MSLPRPHCSFQIPSLHDGTQLDCRLYFPRGRHLQGKLLQELCLIAHPYAPLGGCYDDPVVHAIGNALLETGVFLVTFNFRGAQGSAGRTSWTGQAEAGDMTSVQLFCLCLLLCLKQSSSETVLDLMVEKPIILLAGYSYGSMIASNLPSLEILRELLSNSRAKTPGEEIRSRAADLTDGVIDYFTQKQGNSSGSADSSAGEISSSHPAKSRGVAFGGNEIATKLPRHSQSLRRSLDFGRLRQSASMSSRTRTTSKEVNEGGQSSLHSVNLDITTAILLVSPLLPPITGILTMFSRPSFKFTYRNGSGISYPDNLVQSQCCAVYGGRDIFTSSKKLRKWATMLESKNDSRFVSREIPGAGHFWTEDGTLNQLVAAVTAWCQSLT